MFQPTLANSLGQYISQTGRTFNKIIYKKNTNLTPKLTSKSVYLWNKTGWPTWLCSKHKVIGNNCIVIIIENYSYFFNCCRNSLWLKQQLVKYFHWLISLFYLEPLTILISISRAKPFGSAKINILDII